MTKTIPSVFKRGKYYCFKYTDRTGVRKQVSTGKIKKGEAQKEVIKFMDQLWGGGLPTTFGKLLDQFCDVTTNPRYQYQKEVGGNYGASHASNVARMCGELRDMLKPTQYLNMEMSDFIRNDIRNIQRMVVKEFGRTNKANKIFKQVKIVFSHAAEEGFTKQNPAYGVSDIQYEKRQIRILPPEEIHRVFTDESLFIDKRMFCLFALEAFTGMRRGELLALTWKQIYNNSIIVDRAFKDNFQTVGLPKWEKKRTIPIAQTVAGYLDDYRKSIGEVKGDDLVFGTKTGHGMDFKNYSQWFKRLRLKAIATSNNDQMKEIWGNFTGHALRHSLNTNLRIHSGLSDLLIRTYLSWQGQNDSAIQENYTHIEARALQPVAEAIDRMYGTDKDGKVLQFSKKA